MSLSVSNVRAHNDSVSSYCSVSEVKNEQMASTAAKVLKVVASVLLIAAFAVATVELFKHIIVNGSQIEMGLAMLGMTGAAALTLPTSYLLMKSASPNNGLVTERTAAQEEQDSQSDVSSEYSVE